MNRIKEIREHTGLSQSQFSEKYGIPIGTLHKWERGAASPPPYVVELLDKVVKMDK